MRFVIDVGKCIDCGGCWVACKDINDVETGIERIRIVTLNEGKTGEKSVPIQCFHCDHPACMLVCPQKAITKRDDGIVLVNQDKCVGCRYCLWACPYGTPQFKKMGSVMEKCTYCVERIDSGLRPACGGFCATKAIFVGKSASEVDTKASSIGAARVKGPTNPDAAYKGVTL